jgi:type IV pilus assembly protein PilB
MTPLQNNDTYIGQLLVRDRIITNDDLNLGLQEQKKNRDLLCNTLVRLGLASEEKIFSILSLQIGVPYLNLKDFAMDPSLLHFIPGNLALACQCVPLKKTEDTLYVAMGDPMNATAIEEIKAYCGIDKLKIFLAGNNELRGVIKKYYGL